MNDPIPFRRPLSAVPAPSEAMAASDQELVAAILRGDTRLAGQIHDRLIGVVEQTLIRVLGCREPEHDDLIQASFEQIIRSLASGSFQGACSLRTWANRITSHVALNAIRARRRERKVLDKEADPADQRGPTLERRAEQEFLSLRIRRHLGAMKLEASELLLMHDVYGHNLNEIAVLIGISPAAAQSRLVRARADLKARLMKEARGDHEKRGRS